MRFCVYFHESAPGSCEMSADTPAQAAERYVLDESAHDVADVVVEPACEHSRRRFEWQDDGDGPPFMLFRVALQRTATAELVGTF